MGREFPSNLMLCVDKVGIFRNFWAAFFKKFDLPLIRNKSWIYGKPETKKAIRRSLFT